MELQATDSVGCGEGIRHPRRELPDHRSGPDRGGENCSGACGPHGSQRGVAGRIRRPPEVGRSPLRTVRKRRWAPISDSVATCSASSSKRSSNVPGCGSCTGAGPRTLAPYGMRHQRGHWYFAGAEPEHPDSVRTYRLDRASEMEVVGPTGAFERPRDFSARDILSSPTVGAGFGAVGGPRSMGPRRRMVGREPFPGRPGLLTRAGTAP